VLAFKHFHYWSHCYVRWVSARNCFAVVGRDSELMLVIFDVLGNPMNTDGNPRPPTAASILNHRPVVFDAIGRDKHALRAGEKPTPQTSAEVLALTHANVIDGVSAQPLRDVTVIVRADYYDRRVITSGLPWESHGSARRDSRLPATTANRRELVPHHEYVCQSSSARRS
jgi:hypothetical protein